MNCNSLFVLCICLLLSVYFDNVHSKSVSQQKGKDGRVRRQSTEGVSGMLSSVGGRLTSMRNSFRETVQPVREALNPMPHFETLGKYLSSASTNTVTRGREMVQNVREVGSRGVSRVRDGMTDAWDNVRDSWEDFWDL